MRLLGAAPVKDDFDQAGHGVPASKPGSWISCGLVTTLGCRVLGAVAAPLFFAPTCFGDHDWADGRFETDAVGAWMAGRPAAATGCPSAGRPARAISVPAESRARTPVNEVGTGG
jgi:hypothetical protein